MISRRRRRRLLKVEDDDASESEFRHERAHIPATYTYDEFVANIDPDSTRFELIDGFIVLRLAGTEQHADIITNLTAALAATARAHGCRVRTESLLRCESDDKQGPMPDVAVYCEEPTSGTHVGSVNPCLIIEVVSPSSGGLDRVTKRDIYMAIPTVRAYLVVDPLERSVTAHFQSSTFSHRYEGDSRAITLGCPPATLSLAEVFN